jgi:hypothetical protein
MESIQGYRHIIDKKTKELLITSVKKVIKTFDLKNIGFVGIIGSLKEEYSHDIDILIFPSKEAKIGEAIISVAEFYVRLGKELKKHHERFYPVVSPKKNMQEMIYYIAGLQEGGAGLIPIHSLFFPDYRSFKIFNPEDFQKEIKKSLINFYGNFEIIKELNDIPQKKLEPYFLILDFEMSSKLKTFPRHLIRTHAESLFNYLKTKYGLEIKPNKYYDLKYVEKEIIRILKELDKRTYN